MTTDAEIKNSFEPKKNGIAGFLRTKFQDKNQVNKWLLIVGLVSLVILSYANTLFRISGVWNDPQYSHGWLIPILAMILIAMRAVPFTQVPVWHHWCGFGLITFGILLRIVGTHYVLNTIDNVSIIPTLIGVFVLVGGLPTVIWAGLPLLFLVFMIPLPRLVNDTLPRKLQTVATVGSVLAMQTLGIDVYREGNQIHLVDGMTLNVAEACSGLRMLTIFIALACALAMISTNRPWWERVMVLASAVPIAVVVNMIRITITGIFYNLGLGDLANHLTHDLAGWVMMPIAIGFLFLGLHILSRIVIDENVGDVVRVRVPSSENATGSVPGGAPRRA